MENEIPNITDYDGSSIFLRMGHASKLGHHYKNRQIPLDLHRSGVFCLNHCNPIMGDV